MKRITIIIILIGSFFNSCTKDSGPIVPALTTTVSFSADIQHIFDQNCTTCHNSAQQATNGNLNLESGHAYQNLVNVAASGYDIKRVTPKDINNSLLYKKIDNSLEYGANMPLGGSLNDADIQLIKAWIEEGALDN